MMRLMRDETGSAYIWAAFLMLALVMVAAVIYNGVDIYTQYQTAETELQRAATVTVVGSLGNAAVRDLVLDVPAADAKALLFDHLRELGYEHSGTNWAKRVNGKTQYTLTNLSVETDGKTMMATAMLDIPLLWKTGTVATVRIPIQARSTVLYID